MLRQLSICAALLLCATACQPQQTAEPSASIGGSGEAHPTSKYRCGDTDLGVQLLGETATVSVNGGTPINLAEQAATDGRTVFSDGQQTISIEAGQLSWTPPQGTSVGCTGG